MFYDVRLRLDVSTTPYGFAQHDDKIVGDGAYDVPLFEKQQSLDKKFVGAISNVPLFVLKGKFWRATIGLPLFLKQSL